MFILYFETHLCIISISVFRYGLFLNRQFHVIYCIAELEKKVIFSFELKSWEIQFYH